MRCGRSHLHPSPGRRVGCSGGLKMYTGGSLNTAQPVTRRDRGEPHPQGGDSPSMRCHGGMRRSAVRCDHLTEIPFLLPVHSIRVNHQTLARCREGGGGVDSSPQKTVFRREGAYPPPARRQGETLTAGRRRGLPARPSWHTCRAHRRSCVRVVSSPSAALSASADRDRGRVASRRGRSRSHRRPSQRR